MPTLAPRWFRSACLAVLSFALLGTTATFAQPKPPAVGQAAPDFRLATLQGPAVQLSKLVADGPVVVVVLRGYPGYQCPACNKQTAELLAAAGKLAEKQAKLLLVYPGDASGLLQHAGEFVQGKTFPTNAALALDPNYLFTNLYGLRWNAPRETAYPATFVVGKDGKVAFAKVSTSHGGRASADEILQALEGR